MDDTMNSYTQVKRKDAPAIGIDLGTSKCCVGVVREGKVTIIENERGSKITPSYVAFTKTMRIVGEDARNQASQNPANTVFGVKRIIGRSFDDPSLKDIKDKFPFTVKQEDGKPRIEVSYREKAIYLSPEQVSAMLLTKMKHIAESHLGCEVTDAVISVPAYFTNAQRQATKDAAVIAGLNVLGLINEPTAAALAYRDNMGPTDETICVVDLGGGKLDVSIITLNANDGIRVEQTMGDTALGGMDFDQQLVDHFAKDFRETTNQNVSRKGLERMRLACEKLKHQLSLLPTAKIQLDCLTMETDLESSLGREAFENQCLKDLISVLQKVLQFTKHGSKGERVKEFTKLIVVGGSTRIPLVQKILKDVFGKILEKLVNPDEAVAHGAAIKAALLAGDIFLKEVKFQEVTAHAIEIKIGHFKDDVVQQNSHETQKVFTRPPELDFNLLQEFALYENLYNAKSGKTVSNFLGSVKLSNLSKPPFSKMVFSIDASGIFCKNIAVDKNQYSIPFCSHFLNTDQLLTQLRSEEKVFQADEEAEKMRLILLSKLGDKCFRLNNLIKEQCFDDDTERNENKKRLINFIDETIDWLDYSPDANKDNCESREKELKILLNALLQPPNNENKIETNKQIITGVDNANAPGETAPKLRHCQSIESPEEEEDDQDNRLKKRNDGDEGDQQTLQRDGNPDDGLPTGNTTNKSHRNYIEYFNGGKKASGTVVTGNATLDSIPSTKMKFDEKHFNYEYALNVDFEAINTSVDPNELHQPGPTTAGGAVRYASLDDAQDLCSSPIANLLVQPEEKSSMQNNSKPKRLLGNLNPRKLVQNIRTRWYK